MAQCLPKGYKIANCGLQLASKWYPDDGTFVTNSVEDMIVLLDLVEQFSTWYHIRLNVKKCKIATNIHDLQTIPSKRNKDDAHRARLAHVHLTGRPISSPTQDEPLRRVPLRGSRSFPLPGCASPLDEVPSHVDRKNVGKTSLASPTHQTKLSSTERIPKLHTYTA